jgi:hypothetical protein
MEPNLYNFITVWGVCNLILKVNLLQKPCKRYRLFKWRKEKLNKLEKGHGQCIYTYQNMISHFRDHLRTKKNYAKLPYVICGGKLHKQRAYLENNYAQA